MNGEADEKRETIPVRLHQGRSGNWLRRSSVVPRGARAEGRGNVLIFAMYSGYIVSAPPSRRLVGRIEPIGELGIEPGQWTRSGQEMPHLASRHGGFGRIFAGIWPHRHRRIVFPHHRAADIRFGEVHRVVDDHGRLQVAADPAPPCANRRQIAPHHSHPADIRLLEMGGRDDKDVAVPFTGRKAAPGMQRVGRRARAAVHPDRDFLLHLVDVTVIRDHLLRGLVDIRPELHLRQDRFERVVPRMRPADELGDVEIFGRPALHACLRARRDGDAGGVADHAAAIFVAGERPPQAREIDLADNRRDRKG